MRKVQVPTRVFPWCIFGVTCTDQCQAFLYQHLSTTVFMATVECCKTICRFTLFNLTIDHLHKLVCPFSTEFEATVCVYYHALYTIVSWNQTNI